jgi:hypothetical protein
METEMTSQTQKRNGTFVSSVRNPRGRFVTGNIGGPGRPRGSRNRLSEQFFADLCADWQAHGPETMAKVRRDFPVAYFRAVASLLRPVPDVDLNNVGRYGELTDEQLLAEMVAAVESFSPGIRISREKQPGLNAISKKRGSHEDQF